MTMKAEVGRGGRQAACRHPFLVMGTGPNSKPVCRYRYFSTSSTGISVWGRYSIERWTIVYSGTKLGVKNSKKTHSKENVRLLKRLHTIGLAMLVWTPNSKKVKQHWLLRECESWGGFYPTFLVNNFRES